MTYARVVVEVAPAHLDHPFDYRVPDGVTVQLGQRVRVSFNGRRRVGWVLGTTDEPSTDPARVRELQAVQGAHAWFDEDDLRLYRWVADRYAASLADVLRHAMPPRVAAVEAEVAAPGTEGEAPTDAVGSAPAGSAPVVSGTAAAAATGAADDARWRAYDAGALLAALAAPPAPGAGQAFWWRPLPGEDVDAALVDLARRVLATGRSVLALVPDPASTLPDALLRLDRQRAADLRVTSDRARYRAFLRCRSGRARVAVGERGAALTPLRDLGLVVVVDEANPAYKERRAPRHHAREVALARARWAGATALLVGDLPSARLARLLDDGHVRPVAPARALERERAPVVETVDLAHPDVARRRGRLAPATARRVTEAVRADGVAVLLAARGGEGAALACGRCGQRLACPVCDGSVRVAAGGGWECPACRWEGAAFACPECGDRRNAPLAAGAVRLARELARSYPQAQVVSMEGFDAPGPDGRPAIAVMTRGSVVREPGWLRGAARVVVLPDADALLRRPAYDAAEDALRLWFAVARWSDRVVLQTAEPANPAVQALVRWDPMGFWRHERERRAELGYPPAASLLLVRTEPAAAGEVAAALRDALPASDEVLGPDATGAVLVKSARLRGTLDALTPLRHAWSRANRAVRVDVDPVRVD